MILVDTNVLIYAIQGDAPQHDPSRELIERVASGNILSCLFPQILLEFFAVVTDTRRMEKPATTDDGLDLVKRYSALFPILQPSPATLNILLSLAAESGASGQRLFDVYIVAQMIDAGIQTICTYNVKDFAGYPVTALTPEDILRKKTDPPLIHDKPRSGGY
jgi:predicted nucleic acid-binding protein